MIVEDPVCRRKVADDILFRMKFIDNQYSFCSYDCLLQFKSMPILFVKP